MISEPPAIDFLRETEPEIYRIINAIEEYNDDFAANLKTFYSSPTYYLMPEEGRSAYNHDLAEQFYEIKSNGLLNISNVEDFYRRMFLHDVGMYKTPPSDIYKDKIKEFAENHIEEYEASTDRVVPQLKTRVENLAVGERGKLVIVKGPMFSGKNTYTTILHKKLLDRGHNVKDYMFDKFGDHVLSRSLIEHPVYGDYAYRPAEPFGYMDKTIINLDGQEITVPGYIAFLYNLMNSGEPIPDTVMLDEASFIQAQEDGQEEILARFVNDLRDNGVNVVLLGLDQDYRGLDLPLFRDPNIVQEDAIIEQLVAYRVNKYGKAVRTGTRTIRWIFAGFQDGQIIYTRDFSARKLIFRERDRIAIYTPGEEAENMQYRLRNREDLLDALNHPLEYGLEPVQEEMYETLEELLYPKAA